MRVEQHDGDRPVDRGLGPQLAQNDRVITTEDQRHYSCGDQRLQGGAELVSRTLGVAGRHREVPAVNYGQRGEYVDAVHRVVRPHQRRRGANSLRAEAGPGPEARGGVERGAEYGGVDPLVSRSRGERHVREVGECSHPRVAGLIWRVGGSVGHDLTICVESRR